MTPCRFVAFAGFSFSFNVGGESSDYRQRQALWQILMLGGSGEKILKIRYKIVHSTFKNKLRKFTGQNSSGIQDLLCILQARSIYTNFNTQILVRILHLPMNPEKHMTLIQP